MVYLGEEHTIMAVLTIPRDESLKIKRGLIARKCYYADYTKHDREVANWL